MAEMSRCMQIRLEQQASQCMLCYDAPCTAVCDAGADPAAMVRSVRMSIFPPKIDISLHRRC